MKQILSLLLISSGMNVFAADFSGTYKCELFDKTDGGFDTTLKLKLNKDTSPKALMDAGYASYDIDFKVKGISYPYTGIAAAHGNNLAIYFESTGEKKNPDDRGVGIATITLDKDKSGKDTISLHKFYYEMSYKGKGNYGFENCKKVD
ncbi:MAG: hypothetical protein K0R14_192 [Burkholderiales bacterium]|jgi:hypothetical protein|nr:hypothetical protein [Burkholderiales bacterium]